MIRHLFKLIWNNKGAYSLLIMEILASFMVLFGVATLIIFKTRNYFEPLGFNYENVWQLSLSNNRDTIEVSRKVQSIYQLLLSYPQIESASIIDESAPFSASRSSTDVNYNGVRAQTDLFDTDENFSRTLGIPAISGRWYRESDQGGKYVPVMINRALAEQLFPNENPVGKVLSKEKNGSVIIGVIENYKAQGEFVSNGPAMLRLKQNYEHKTILIKVKPGTGIAFEEKMLKNISNVAKDWNTELTYLTDSRKNNHLVTYIPVIIFMIICVFLLINVALGLFGVLNLNINQRRSEIGLRRAAGATEKNIVIQFLGEIWMLASFSLAIGLLFAIQFPLLNILDIASGVYIMAILAAVFLIFLIVTLCAWYPSHKASRIQPAIALHDD